MPAIDGCKHDNPCGKAECTPVPPGLNQYFSCFTQAQPEAYHPTYMDRAGRHAWSRVIVSLVMALLSARGMTAAAADSPLADAAMKRDMAAVRALLAQKVDVNAPGSDGTPALHWSVRADDLETARLLLVAGAELVGIWIDEAAT